MWLFIFKRLILVAVLLAVSAGALFAEDTKLFSSLVYKQKLSENLDYFLQPELRFNNNISNWNYYHLRAGIVFHQSPTLDLNLIYRYKGTKDTSDVWTATQRLEGEIIPKFSLAGFASSLRSRFELRDAGKTNVVVYRAMPKIDFRNFYLGDEIFYKFQDSEIFQNWFILGKTFSLREGLGLNLFYMYESIRNQAGSSDWTNAHVVGTKLSWSK